MAAVIVAAATAVFAVPAQPAAADYDHKCDWEGVEPNPAYTELKEMVDLSREWDMTQYAVDLYLNDRATWDDVTQNGSTPGTGPGPQGLQRHGVHYELNRVNMPTISSFRGVSLSHVNPCIMKGDAPNREVPAFRPERPGGPTLSQFGYTEGDPTGGPSLDDPWPWVSILAPQDRD